MVAFTPCISRAQQPPVAATVLSVDGSIELLRAGSTNWSSASAGAIINIGDQMRSGPNSRATLRLSNLSVLRVGELMTYEIEPPRTGSSKPIFNIESGSAYFFSRDKPQEIQLRTPMVSGAIRGTEFNVMVESNGLTTVTMIDGVVELTNALGDVTLKEGDQGVAEAGSAPVKTAVLNAVNIIQWNLYYPGVLDPAEIDLNSQERETLASSLAAYSRGESIEALNQYPTNHQPASAGDHLYLGGLLLAVGLVDRSLPQLDAAASGGGDNPALANALHELIASVKFETWSGQTTQSLATEFLAESYYQQSRANLNGALRAARKAVEKSPSFAFAWERVAELEFSFGHTESALDALNKSLSFAPRNPQAIALKGFLLTAQNRIGEAIQQFDKAIAIDGSLGNAWIGRGLCKIRQGNAEAGREDLEVAAALEPNRAVLRSYLGKAFSQMGDDTRANHELELARKFDPNDPTSWFYLALLHQQENQINQAIRELEKSEELNDDRSVYRSRMLLDEDRAVEGANLASIYNDAGMSDVSVREAASAVNEDYANASAHLFLSDAYNDLRDPTQFNLRYETVWFNELLLANLLSPVGGGRLSQEVSQQEYSKLFQQDGFDLASSTDVRSDKMYHEQASQFGTFGNTSYALDLDYHHNDGIRPNNGLDDTELDFTIKQQVTPQDTALLLVQNQDYHSGDNFQYYNPTNARPNYTFNEYQHPILVGGWDHEWSPGIRTLALVARLSDEQKFSDKAAPQLVVDNDPVFGTNVNTAIGFDVNYHNSFDIYSAELNQIFEWDRVTLSAGARYQSGTFQTQDTFINPENVLNNPPTSFPTFFLPPATNSISENFRRLTGYGYLTVEPLERLWLTGGFAYDTVTFPDNYRQPPVSSGEDTRSQLGPKAALVWNPVPPVTLRGVYTRSLGGVSLDESYRLEPTQLAGFPQAFRSLISESIVGSVDAPSFETLGVALDLKLGTRTFAGFQVEQLKSSVSRTIGIFEFPDGTFPVVPGSTPEQLDYRERTASVNLNQLVGDRFVLGTSYKITQSDLHDVLTQISVSVFPAADQMEQSLLQDTEGYIQFNHPSGFFARAEMHWYGQSNFGWTPDEPGDRFFQYNLFAGWYFAHRRGELQLGILNLTGGSYNLNSLTPYQGLPESRVFEAKLNFVF